MTIVSGDSMLPTYRGDDLVVTWHEESYVPDTIVVYRIPSDEVGSGINIVHRIVERKDGGYVTQGDNNRTIDPWTPTDANIQGRALFHVPHGGFVLRWILSPLMLATLSGLLVTLSVLSSARRPRRGPPGGQDDPAEPGDDPGRDPEEQEERQEQPEPGRRRRTVRALLVTALAAALTVVIWSATTGAAATLGQVTSDQLFMHTESVSIEVPRPMAHVAAAPSTGVPRARSPARARGSPPQAGPT